MPRIHFHQTPLQHPPQIPLLPQTEITKVVEKLHIIQSTSALHLLRHLHQESRVAPFPILAQEEESVAEFFLQAGHEFQDKRLRHVLHGVEPETAEPEFAHDPETPVYYVVAESFGGVVV
jgi:hypothetical protein